MHKANSSQSSPFQKHKSRYLKVEVSFFEEDIAERLRDILARHQYHTTTKHTVYVTAYTFWSCYNTAFFRFFSAANVI